MAEPNLPERIEIELTPNEESRIWGRHGSGVPNEGVDLTAPAPPGRAETGPTSGDLAYTPPLPPSEGVLSVGRGRVVAAGVAVAVTALLIGWAVGRSGSDTDGELDADVGTTAVPETTDDIGATLPIADPASVPTTTRRTTPGPTTVPPGWTLSTTEVDGRVAELGIDIVAARSREIVDVDTASGEMASIGQRTSYQQPPALDAGPDWIVVRSFDTSQAMLFQGRDLPEQISVGDAWSTFRQPGTDRFWRMSSFSDGSANRVVEVDHRGDATGVSLELAPRNWALGPDPLGGLVVAAPGGIYHVDPDGSRRITVGELIGLGATKALAAECGDDLTTCGLVVRDRSTGEAAPLTPIYPENIDAATAGFENPGNFGMSGMLTHGSPDGRFAPLVVTGPGRRHFGVIDLTSGQFHPFTDFPESGLWWTPDSRGVMYLQSGRLMMYDFDEGVPFEVLPNEQGFQAFTVRS